MAELKKSLSLFGGTALFLNIVIGAGLLVLPGIVFKQVGSLALASWLVCAIAVLPLIAVFVLLGKDYPDAGGISHYAYRAFGSMGQRVASLLLLGAVAFGLPSIAITGGCYIQRAIGGSVHLYAMVLIVSAAWLHRYSGQALSRSLALIGSSVIAALLILIIIGATSMKVNVVAFWHQCVPSSSNLSTVMAPFMMIFFAFTGWEVGSHSAEEFKNPRRDFPLAMILSFIIATALYAGIAAVVQLSNLSGNFEAPFIAITHKALGTYGKHFVALVAVLLIFANLFGAIWGVSRLVYSLGRDRVIPSFFAETSDGAPIRAVVITTTVLLVVLLLDYIGALGIGKMLALAGQNFLLLYGIAASALFVLSQKATIRMLSALVVLLTVGITVFAGSNLLYPAVLVVLGVVTGSSRKSTRPANASNPMGAASDQEIISRMRKLHK
jgi:amino acid efflux transporter